MTGVAVVALAILTALLVSAALSRLIAWSGPVDRPRERGMHDAPTPTAGGLAMIAGTGAGLLLFQGLGGPHDGLDAKVAASFGLAALLGLFGALDDLHEFGARTKLLVQLVVALAFAVFVARPAAIPIAAHNALVLAPAFSIAGTALWIVVVVNAVNFMDGANGLVAGAMIIVGGALGMAALPTHATLLSVGLLAASSAGLGFLPTNYPNARLFQGDAGAQFTGALAAMLAVVGAGSGKSDAPITLLAAPIALTPLLTDVLLTLIARARRRTRLFDAHREHLYQRWMLAKGGDHAKLAHRVWLIVGAYALAALVVARHAPGEAWPVLIVGVTISVGGWLAINQRLRRPG